MLYKQQAFRGKHASWTNTQSLASHHTPFAFHPPLKHAHQSDLINLRYAHGWLYRRYCRNTRPLLTPPNAPPIYFLLAARSGPECEGASSTSHTRTSLALPPEMRRVRPSASKASTLYTLSRWPKVCSRRPASGSQT
jgi:hypothetical protein